MQRFVHDSRISEAEKLEQAILLTMQSRLSTSATPLNTRIVHNTVADSFKTVETVTGSTQGSCRYVTVDGVPSATRSALVRFVGSQRNTTAILSLRIDADYVLPGGGFRQVKVTYRRIF